MTAAALPPATRQALRAIAALHEACADPARLRLLNLLAAGELCVCDLTALTGLGQPFVSRHLARLRAAGVVTVARRGKFAYYRVAELAPALARPLEALLTGPLAADPRLVRERRAAAAAVRRRLALPCT